MLCRARGSLEPRLLGRGGNSVLTSKKNRPYFLDKKVGLSSAAGVFFETGMQFVRYVSVRLLMSHFRARMLVRAPRPRIGLKTENNIARDGLHVSLNRAPRADRLRRPRASSLYIRVVRHPRVPSTSRALAVAASGPTIAPATRGRRA